MKTIYLDQNKWIELARAFHGRETDARLLSALAFVQAASGAGSHAFPLSAIHYLETAKLRGGTRRRAQLGVVMWKLSVGQTMAPYREILRHELETALAQRFPFVHPRPFALVAHGVAHTFGLPRPPYRIPEPHRDQLPPHAIRLFENVAQDLIEQSVLTGVGPSDVIMEPFGATEHNRRFVEHLTNLHPRLAQLPGEGQEDALYAMSLSDIKDVVNDVLAIHRIPADALLALGRQGLKQFVDSLPSRRVDLHLHRQLLRNPQLRPKMTDLEDWGGLGPAAAYCDVLVCEKHFASLLLRDGFRPHATVLTDLKDLPNVA